MHGSKRRRKTMKDERRLKVRSGGVLNSRVFREASKEELRVLVAVMENPFSFSSADEIADAAGVSRARALSAVTLFIAEGIFVREGDISYEFEERVDYEEPIERTSLEVSESIRKKGLAELYSELAKMMDKSEGLNNGEIKRIESLISDAGLSEEYILTLATYIHQKKNLTVSKLCKEASKLSNADIDTVEVLNKYIKENEDRDYSLEAEFNITFNRKSAPDKVELEFYRKWTETYGFMPEVIKYAKEVNILSSTRYTYAYMDDLITKWHESGCTTLEDCKKAVELFRAQIAEEKRIENKEAMSKKSSKSKAPTPKFGDFDPSEAFEKALQRSYAKYADETETED